MQKRTLTLLASGLALTLTLFLALRPTSAYIEVPYSLGKIINDSSTITVLKVTAVDRAKNTISYAKVEDLKGKSPETVKHNIAQAGFHPREWQTVMAWAQEGKTAVFFHNGSASETCIDNYWYQCYPGGEWWNMFHAEPFLLRTYAGKAEKIIPAVKGILNNEEVVVTCMVDGDKNAIALRTARIQRLKASLKVQDYNAARDFVGWGGEEIRPVRDMPGYSHLSVLPKIPGNAAFSIQSIHLDADPRLDLLLTSNEKILLLQNAGNGSFNELSLPLDGGANSAAFADYNNSGKQSLLLATPTGPQLLSNIGASSAGPKWRNDSAAFPAQPYSHLTAATWFSLPENQKPLAILADAYTGLHVFRNTTPQNSDLPEPPVPTFEKISVISPSLVPAGKITALLIADVNSDNSPELLLATPTSLTVLTLTNGTFAPLGKPLQFKAASAFTLADLNADSTPDLALIDSGSLRIFLSAKNTFTESPAPSLTNLTSIAPLKTEKSTDLLLGATNSENRYLANNGRAQFTDATESLGLNRRRFNSIALLALPNGDLAMLNANQDNAYLLAKK